MTNQKPIRILQVQTEMSRAGAETMLMNLYRTIDRERIQFDFAVTANRRCDYDDEIEALGGKLIHYPHYRGVNHFQYMKWWRDFFPRHPEYRIVHGHTDSTAGMYLSVAKANGRLTIAHSHNTGYKSPLHRIYAYGVRYVADYFMACSKDAMVCRFGQKVASNRSISFILRNGIDVSEYGYDETVRDAVREDFEISRDALTVGAIGRFTNQKNPFFIVDILDELRKMEPDFRFLWAGDGELKADVERRIEQKGLQKNVILLGVRDDIPCILQALNVFILPSKYEGLGIVGIEAQAAGVPTLLSNRIPAETQILPAGCKFLPIRSARLWAEEIVKEKNFRRIAGASEKVAQAGYDVRNTAEWLTSFYERVSV